MRNDLFPFRIGKGKTPISGIFAPETRQKNCDMQKLLICSSYYNGFYIGTGCFCDENISARRYTLILIFGGQKVVTTQNFCLFQVQKFFFWKMSLPKDVYRVTQGSAKPNICSFTRWQKTLNVCLFFAFEALQNSQFSAFYKHPKNPRRPSQLFHKHPNNPLRSSQYSISTQKILLDLVNIS